MTMTTIDWGKAGERARIAFDEQVQSAAGDIVAGIDDLVGDPNVSRKVKLAVIEQLGQVVGDRERLQELLTGKVVSPTPKTLGPSDSSKDDEIARLKGELDKAKTANANLIKDRGLFEEIVLDLGLTAPASTSTPFNSDTPKRVKEKIKEMVAKAEAEAKKAAGAIDKSKIKTAFDEVQTALGAVDSHRGSTKVNGLDKLAAKLRELAEACGLKTAGS